MKMTIKMGVLVLASTLVLTGCSLTPRRTPGTPCGYSQRGQTARASTDGHNLTCSATYVDRTLRWR
jgi:hypothetical protein